MPSLPSPLPSPKYCFNSSSTSFHVYLANNKPYMTLAANHMEIHRRNEFLDTNLSEDDEDISSPYEAAADSRIAGLGRHRSKRQKLPVEHSDSNEETDHDSQDDVAPVTSPVDPNKPSQSSPTPTTNATEPISPNLPADLPKKRKPLTTSAVAATNKRAHKAGVIYLSRIPPFMRPSTVRTLLSAHGTITRLFLTPETPSTYLSRRKAGGNKKHSYIDGWVEFSRKRDAKICVDAINGQIVGGKKGGWYRDDVWNAKYLKGFGWNDLMAGVRGEEREREERVRVGVGRERRERAEFLRNLERARVEGTRRAKSERRAERAGGGEEMGVAKGVVKTDAFERRFRQNEVKGRDEKPVEQSDETRRVLSKIF